VYILFLLFETEIKYQLKRNILNIYFRFLVMQDILRNIDGYMVFLLLFDFCKKGVAKKYYKTVFKWVILELE